MDRNIECLQKEPYNMKSLSARRAWIEISVNSHTSFLPRVALRKESVDRNTVYGIVITFENWSLSARRAWIEIVNLRVVDESKSVALRKESVDRNITIITICTASRSRSPQGERG